MQSDGKQYNGHLKNKNKSHVIWPYLFPLPLRAFLGVEFHAVKKERKAYCTL